MDYMRGKLEECVCIGEQSTLNAQETYQPSIGERGRVRERRTNLIAIHALRPVFFCDAPPATSSSKLAATSRQWIVSSIARLCGGVPTSVVVLTALEDDEVALVWSASAE